MHFDDWLTIADICSRPAAARAARLWTVTAGEAGTQYEQESESNPPHFRRSARRR